MKNELSPIPKKLNIWLPFLLSVVMVGGMLIGTKMQSNPPTVASIDMPEKKELGASAIGQGKLEELIRYIESRYVDNVDKDELVKEAIDKILFQLDPHSSYISAEELQGVNDQLQGSFDGIGIEFLVVDDTVMVVSAIPGGPAEGAGIMPGDKVVEIEDSLRVGENVDFEGILDRLKGVKGSKIKLGMRRGVETKLRYFTLTRDKIPVHTVEVAYMLDDKTGYLKINRFSATTYQEFRDKLGMLVDSLGMENLVLDLRGNPGGYLEEATKILDQIFSEKDQLFVYTEGNNVPRNEYKSTGRSYYELKNIGVLVDEGSASASEIIAGAIQDQDRGVIVGRRTFGKGLVQEQYRLRDGSAIRLTVARYHTPSGRCIQKSYEDREDYDEEVSERVANGELYDGSKFLQDDTTKFYTRSNRVVYGGGGIAPDVFVPLEAGLLNSYYAKLHQHVPSYTFRYVNSHRKELAQMNLEDFVKNFQVTDALANEFMDYAVKHGQARNDRQWKMVSKEIKLAIKAHIARHLWSDRGYQLVENSQDAALDKAFQLVKSGKPLTLK